MARTSKSAEGFGVPPPHAPREVSQPITPQALEEMLAKARRNERAPKPVRLYSPPSKSPPSGGEAPPAPSASPSAAPELSSSPLDTAETSPPEIPEDLEIPVPLGPHLTPADQALVSGQPPPETELPLPQIPEDREVTGPEAYQPAASDTDSPSRGLPRPQPRGKEITGGWGLGTQEPSYFALDGSELLQAARTLWDRLNSTLDQDLRFSLAVTYPQVKVTVKVVVEGAVPMAASESQAFTVSLETLLELSQSLQDSEESPPDLVRESLGLQVPGKHLTETRQWVDR